MWEKIGKSPRKINQSTHYEMSHWHCVMHVGEGTSYYTRPEMRKQCTSYHTDDLFYLLYNQSHVTLALKSQKSIHSILKSALSCLGPRIFRIFWQTNGKLSRTTSDDSCPPVARKKTGESHRFSLQQSNLKRFEIYFWKKNSYKSQDDFIYF